MDISPHQLDPEHGSMDISQQRGTYHILGVGLRYSVLIAVVTGSFLIITFCTSAGWAAGFWVALIETALGLYLAKDRPKASWQSEVVNLVVTTSAESGH